MALPTQDSIQFLERVLSTPSPSGFEDKVQNVIRDEMAPLADEATRDVHGNQWFVLNPEAELRVMLCGHVDEIGLMVHFVDDDGFLWVNRIGGTDMLNLWGSRVLVHNKKESVPGVIGKKPIHHTKPGDRDKGPKIEDVFIDIGAKNKKDALKHVKIGDPVTMAEGYQRMTKDRVIARGMDDRIGAFVVMEAFRKVAAALKGSKRRTLNCALYAVASVQEEVGLRGSRTSAFTIDPHVGIAVDVGFATDYPGENKKAVGDFKLGKGPILHRGPNINAPLADFLETLAEKKKIAFQPSGDGGIMGTDAASIQVSRRGVAAALVSIPNRYMHSPVEMVALQDVEASARLLAEAALNIKPKQSFIPGD
jgi:endoglucanase